MDKLNFNDGACLRERAQHHADLLQFMVQHAEPETWAKAATVGLKPEAGPWVVFMNQHRIKRAATPAEAATIVRLLQARYGILSPDEVMHALRDPVWALFNLSQMGKPAQTTHLISEL